MKALAGAWLLIAGAALYEIDGSHANTFVLSLAGSVLIVLSITGEGG